MKKLRRQFKEILSNECLSQKEKDHLKALFRSFIERRELIARPSLITEESEEEYSLDIYS